MAQHGAGKHDHCRGYMTVVVINHGNMTSISILTAVIRLMLKFDVDKPWDSFRPEVQWRIAMH